MGHLRPVPYVDSVAHHPACQEMTRGSTPLEAVCLHYCLLKPDGQNQDGTAPPVPGYPTRDREASSAAGVWWERSSAHGFPVFKHRHQEAVRF